MFGLIIGLILFPVLVFVIYRIYRDFIKCLHYSRNLPLSNIQPDISIIKPVKGADEFSENNYRSWLGQDYSGTKQVIFSFQDKSDPGIVIVKQIQDLDHIKIVVNPVAEGFSGKMSNLFYGLKKAKYNILILSDSDIYAYPTTCRQIVYQLENRSDMVSCLTRHLNPKNLWARIFAGFWNFEQIGFIAPSILENGNKAMGGTIGLSKNALNILGGIEAFKDYVAEDVAMGTRAKELGIKVSLGPIVDSPVGTLNFNELINKFTRAALYGISMKKTNHNSQYAILYSYLLILILSAIFWNYSLMILGFLLAISTLILKSHLWFLVSGEKRVCYESIFGDVIFLSVFFKSLFLRTTTWGGIKYRVLSGGRMVKL
ncbi:MAG: hypothetical protein DHS20C13_13160 [Thermodesulfobacteriota bacterium]|nr:MAG: hypothetical protein DHS20C13_13160 [Thermodesulfobacteriota bacterium]